MIVTSQMAMSMKNFFSGCFFITENLSCSLLKEAVYGTKRCLGY